MIQAQTKNDVLFEGVEETVKMSIALDEANQAHIVKVLSENYKYPIASTIREAASNAWDSHLMNNTPEKPFFVRFYKNETGNYNLEIEDFGLGLDKEGFYKYYMQIGNSTKQGVAGVLGFFGCGAKAALSIEGLTNYEVICRKDGIENKFLIFKGEKFPESLPLHELPIEEDNGVLIRIPISYRDRYTTIEAIKEQLCYFKTACIQIEGDNTNYLEKKIFENDLFSWSEVYPSNEMHINFGGVHYPIDWNILKINKISLPVGIKIAPDNGINPFFNRESLDYTTLCKETILNRIKEVAEYFVNRYNETNIVFKDIFHIREYYSTSNKYLELEGASFKINELEKYSDVKLVYPTYPNIKELDLNLVCTNWNYFLCTYKIIAEINSNRFTTKINKKSSLDKLNQPLYLIDTLPKKQVIDYLKEKHDCCYFVKKISNPKLKRIDYRDIENYYYLLNLDKQPKSLWRTLIQDWQELENELLNKINSLPEVSKEWIEARKKVRQISVRNQKLEGEINFKIAKPMEKYSSDWNCKFESTILNLKDFHKNKYLMVYGLDIDRIRLDDLYELGRRSKSNIKIAIVGERDYKKLETVKIHNLVKMDDFVKEKHKIIAKYATAYKINILINENIEVFKTRNFIIKNISTNFGNALNELYQYKEQYTNYSNDLMKQLVLFCEENNFFDYPIYQTYKEVAKEIHKINFIKLFADKSKYIETIKEEAIPIIRELLVSRKFRMDYPHYQTETVLPTEVLEEETILED